LSLFCRLSVESDKIHNVWVWVRSASSFDRRRSLKHTFYWSCCKDYSARSQYQAHYHLDIRVVQFRFLAESGRSQYCLLPIVWCHVREAPEVSQVSFLLDKFPSLTSRSYFQVQLPMNAILLHCFLLLRVAVVILGLARHVATLDMCRQITLHLSCTVLIQKILVEYLTFTATCTWKFRCCLILCSLQVRGAGTIDFVSVVCRGLWLTNGCKLPSTLPIEMILNDFLIYSHWYFHTLWFYCDLWLWKMAGALQATLSHSVSSCS